MSQDPILRIKEVRRELGGVCASTIYDWVRRGLLPSPVKIGPRASGWPLSWIEQFKRERMDASQH